MSSRTQHVCFLDMFAIEISSEHYFVFISKLCASYSKINLGQLLEIARDSIRSYCWYIYLHDNCKFALLPLSAWAWHRSYTFPWLAFRIPIAHFRDALSNVSTPHQRFSRLILVFLQMSSVSIFRRFPVIDILTSCTRGDIISHILIARILLLRIEKTSLSTIYPLFE